MNQKIKTQQIPAIIELRKQYTIKQIAKMFMVAPATISQILLHKGMRFKNKNNITQIEKENIVADYNKHIAIRKLSLKYKYNYRVIKNVLSEFNIICKNRSQCRQKYTINENYFKNIDTPEKAYFLGFLYADGGNTGIAIILTLHKKDVHILNEFKMLIQTNKPLMYLKNTYFSLSITNKQIINDLTKHGIVKRKTQIIRMPKLPDELASHFIRGYFDGDGGLCIQKKLNKATLTLTSNELFLSDLCNYMNSKLSLNLTYRKVKNKNIFRITICGNKQILKILKYMYFNSTIHLIRKYELFQQLKTNPISNKIPII